MYAESIVQERLSVAEESLGWKVDYHSVDEVDKFQEYLSQWEKYNSDGELYFARDLRPVEYRFIQNEKVLCTCDAAYYLTRYARIIDEKDSNIRFRFRDTQRIYFHVISGLEGRGKSVELLIAKGRQVGITTITELLIGHRIFFHHNANALTASADRTKSEEMGKKILFTYDNLPWWLRPKYSRRIESVPGLLEFENLNSRVSIQHGSGQAKAKGQQRIGLGRGGTRTIWHVSEAALIPNPEQQIEAALMNATHESPVVFGVIESTFAGGTGWFPDKYDSIKQARDAGTYHRLNPLFFNWACNTDLCPTKSWIRVNPVPDGWRPNGKAESQIRKAELFIRNDPLLSSYFGSDYEMPMHQQWYYQCRYDESARDNTMNTLMQEFPCDDIEARVASYASVFKPEVIEVCHREREKKFDVYGIVGQSIESRHEPNVDEIDYDQPRIPITHRSKSGKLYKWELVPLLYKVYEGPTGHHDELDDINNVLFVYKQPDFRSNYGPESGRRKRYGIGVDTGAGMGYDYTGICVTDVGDGAIPDVQVAEWRSNTVGHVEAFAFVMPIALYFTHPDKDMIDYPLIGIEQLASVGDVCQSEMKKLGYPWGRFFDFGRYDTKRRIKQRTDRQGWFTTGWSRPILTGYYVLCVENGWYKLNSPWTIEECREFEVHKTTTGKSKLEHSDESHDDCIFASAISSFIMHDMETIADRSKSQYRGNESTKPPINLTPNNGFNVNPGTVAIGNTVSMNDMLNYIE